MRHVMMVVLTTVAAAPVEDLVKSLDKFKGPAPEKTELLAPPPELARNRSDGGSPE